MRQSLSYALLAASLACATPARAEVHALLIGVGDYLSLDADLKGPPNDARLMAETLTARGVAPEAITVLTTDPRNLPQGVTSAAPTRAAILAAMASFRDQTQPGDSLLFYFSGHGAQAPDQSGDEGGGYDEIFLPSDAAQWQGEIGAVENAILDDEMQLWAQSVLAKDVQLIGVIDACHSATGFRALGDAAGAVTGGEMGVARSLDPAALGIPEDATATAFTGATTLKGDFVFLYSSQSDERSFEYPLGDTGIWHGEFTLRLAQVLGTATEASWAQVLAATSEAMQRGPTRQLPEGEGPLLHQGVFGSSAGATRLRLQDGTLQAGLLQGVESGSRLTLYAEGVGGAPLGEATVAKASARAATLDAAPPADAAWAEVTAAPPPQPLRLAAPRRLDAADGQDYSAWEAALAAYGAAAASADLIPVLTDGGIVLAGPDGVFDAEGPGSSLRIWRDADESAKAALRRTLETIAHGLRLREVLSTAAGRGVTKTTVISVEIERRPGTVTPEGCSGQTGPGQAYDPVQGVAGCDQLWLTLTNRSGKAQDVSVLYLASDYEVQPIWPSQNMVNRLAPGESTRVGLQIDPVTAATREEIWVLAVPMDGALAPRTDLTLWATLQLLRGAMASPATPMALWLDAEIAFDDREATSLRGFSLKPADLTMIRQILRLKPSVQ